MKFGCELKMLLPSRQSNENYPQIRRRNTRVCWLMLVVVVVPNYFIISIADRPMNTAKVSSPGLLNRQNLHTKVLLSLKLDSMV
jgi:hypothetical protein